MKRTMLVVLTALYAVLGSTAAETATAQRVLKADRNMERAAHELASNLPQMHLSRMAMDESVATNALTLFLRMLDFEHSYFLASDIAGFQQEGPRLTQQLADGDLSFAFRVFNTFLDRVSNRVDYVRELLKKDVDLSADESYLWKRKDAPWPKDQAEWDDLWRRRVKNQLVARKVSDALGTNTAALAAAEKEDEPPTHSDTADAKLTPQEGIVKGYERFHTVLRDNDAQWVTERYLNAFTMAYDPHTSYMAPESQEDFEIQMNLSLVGIGALLSPDEGTAKVERVIPGGPADRDGRLKPGDKIIGVGQGEEPIEDIVHLPLNKAVKKIRGKKDTTVVLKYIAGSDPSGSTIKTISLVRDEVKLEESAAKGEVREIKGADGQKYSLGVITLPEFYADMRQGSRQDTEPRYCSRDVAKIIEDLKRKDIEGIVLDLRNNGGGSLSEAINIAGLFLPRGPVVQVKDRSHIQSLNDENGSVAYDGPLIVMVNRFSASASEIVAAALQDYDRAIVVGDSKTHGKGTVQSLTPLSPLRRSLGSLKVTTASFYRIAGGSTQLKGVTPDIVIPSTLESLEVGEEFLPNAMPWDAIGPAPFEVDDKVGALIPQLRKRSEERRAGDPKFSALTSLMERLREQQKNKEITLKFDDRLQLAKVEKELQKQLEESDPGKKDEPAAADKKGEAAAKGAGKDDKKNDIVLGEALNILADWVHTGESKAANTAGTEPNHT